MLAAKHRSSPPPLKVHRHPAINHTSPAGCQAVASRPATGGSQGDAATTRTGLPARG